jgi:hypothetical protein
MAALTPSLGAVELMVCSPLSRAIDTGLLAFPTLLPPPGLQQPGRIIAYEDVREYCARRCVSQCPLSQLACRPATLRQVVQHQQWVGTRSLAHSLTHSLTHLIRGTAPATPPPRPRALLQLRQQAPLKDRAHGGLRRAGRFLSGGVGQGQHVQS